MTWGLPEGKLLYRCDICLAGKYDNMDSNGGMWWCKDCYADFAKDAKYMRHCEWVDYAKREKRMKRAAKILRWGPYDGYKLP